MHRIASAWSIRRAIDPEARVKFAAPAGYPPEPGDLRFGMFEAEFTHRGARCMFETLLARYALVALVALGQVVHDVDFKKRALDRVETAGVFLPTYLFVALLVHRYYRVAQNRQLRAAVDGVAAAATGAIAGAAFVLGRCALIDVPTWLLFAATLALVLGSNRKGPEPLPILVAATAGIAIQGITR